MYKSDLCLYPAALKFVLAGWENGIAESVFKRMVITSSQNFG